MKVGFLGLGKMGYNIALNAIDNNIEVIGFDVDEDARKKASKDFEIANSLDEIIEKLKAPRFIFLSLPAGKITDDTIDLLAQRLDEGDIVIDSGNTNYKKTLEHNEILKNKNIGFVDCGTSGGMSGARNGACLMVGGEKKDYEQVKELFEAISCEKGLLYTGKPGSGHYLKMIHNGIEYGMMQAIGEGFAILEKSEFDYNYEEVSRVWNHGSVIRSWLIELAEEGFAKDPKLDSHSGVINANGECKWTVEEALRLDVPAPVISNSLFVRNTSKIDVNDNFSNKVVAQLRNGFGGHALVKKDK